MEAPKRIWRCAGCGCPPPFDCDCDTNVAFGGAPRRSKWKSEVLVSLGYPDPDATILAAEHDRIVAEKDAEIEEAFARGVNWAQEKAKVEGRLVIVDSPELVNLRTENARLREAMDGAYERAEKRRKAFYGACHGTDEGMEASLYKMFLEGFDAAIRAMKGE